MPLDGNGNHNPPSPENPVRAGTLIKSDDFNTTIDDISDALSTAIYRDGQAAMEADLNMGHNSIVQVKSIRNDEQLSLYSSDKLVLSADKGVVVDSDLRAKNIALQDGVKVSGHTATGGVENAGKSVLLNDVGQIDIGMIPLAPPSPTEIQLLRIITGAELNAGDFVYLATDDTIMPTTANPQALVIGFVLNDYQQGDIAEVLLTGINSKVAVIGEITETTRTAYTSPYKANQILTTQDGQAVGIILSASSIYFRGLGSGGGGGGSLLLSKYMSI